MTMPEAEGSVRLKPTEDERIRRGHVWVYANEVARIEGAPPGGAVVWVEDDRGRKLGTGFFDGDSQIAVRLLTRGAASVFSASDVTRLLAAAFERRRPLAFDCVRLVNAEGDYMPGLVMDRYGDTVVVQPKIPGWKRDDMTAAIAAAVARLAKPRAVTTQRFPLIRAT